MDKIVDEIDDRKFEIRSQTATKGSANVGYNGQTTTNSLFGLSASQVDAALDSIADAIDAEMKNQDDYEARVLSQVATDGSAIVGYDGQAGANALFNLAASQVDAALDSLGIGLDAEMKSTDDFIALLDSNTAAEGSSNIGYDGANGANALFTLPASKVDAALDSLVTGLDAEM
ncbi:MAG: hypothetical protein H8D97_00630, partial [Proteobacteria bacterium]|nr:hypothetical protein [Pseudomonadota bacterium]